MNPTKTIGFIGLGNMGLPMARRLLAAGYTLKCFDINAESMQVLGSEGAIATDSVAGCAADVDILMTSLPRPDHVREVMEGETGGLASLQHGAIWIDLTTNRRELLQQYAAENPRISIVDAPVTGAVDGAIKGRLTLFAGGSDSVVDQVEPILAHLGTVIRAGELGHGNVIKLVTNQLWFVAAAALGEGFATGMANGVDLKTLWQAIGQSVGNSFVVEHDAPSIFAGHYDPSFSLDLCLKDLGLISHLAEVVNAELPMTTAAHQAFSRAAERYGADAAELHVAKRIEDDSGLSFRIDGDWIPHWDTTPTN